MIKRQFLFLLLALLLVSCQPNQYVLDPSSTPYESAESAIVPSRTLTAHPIAPETTLLVNSPTAQIFPSSTFLPTITPGLLSSEQLGYQWLTYRSNAKTLLAGDLLVETDFNSISALDPSTGRQRWQVRLPGVTGNSNFPFVVIGKMIVVAVTRISDTGRQSLILIGLNRASGTQVWSRPIREISASESLIVYSELLSVEGAVLVTSRSSNSNFIKAVNPNDGQDLWSRDDTCSIPFKRPPGTSWQASAGSFLLECRITGGWQLVQLSASSGMILGEMPASGGFLEAALFGDVAVAISPDVNSRAGAFSIIGFRWPGGEILWQAEHQGSFGGWLAGEGLLSYRAGNLIRQIDPTTGRLNWETLVAGITGINLRLSGGSLYAGSQDGVAACLDPNSGRLLWQRDLWAGLNPSWSRINILGTSGRTLLVQLGEFPSLINTAHYALAALVPNAPSTWLTPAPTSTPLPPEAYVPTATQVPFSFIRTPPSPLKPGWTPASPPVVKTGQDKNSVLPAYLRLAAELLAYTRGNLEEFIRLVKSWGEIHSYDPAGAIWARWVDLNGDGLAEVLASLPLLQEESSTDKPGITGIYCGIFECPRLVAIFKAQGSIYIPAGLFVWGGSPWLEDPQLQTIDDLDGDGKSEVVFMLTRFGLRDTNNIVVGQWNESSWLLLTGSNDLQGNISQVRFYPMNGIAGKVMEITFDPPQVLWIYGRTHTRIYTWQAGQPKQIQDIPAPSNDAYFLLIDAHTALTNGQADRALELALKAFKTAKSQHIEVSLETGHIFSFAAIDAMLAYALKGDPVAMQRILAELDSAANPTNPDPYLFAAHQLMDVFQATQDAKLACAEMAAVVRQNWENASLLGGHQGSTDNIELEHICPLQ